MKSARALGALLLLSALTLNAEELIGSWDFTEATAAELRAVTSSGGPAAIRFASPLQGISINDGALVVASNGEIESYTGSIKLKQSAIALEVEITDWAPTAEKATVHYGLMSNTNSVVAADITIEAGPNGALAYGRALGKGSAKTQSYTFPAGMKAVKLRLVVDMANHTMSLEASSAGENFKPVASGKIAPDRPAAYLRLRATGNWGSAASPLKISKLSVSSI